MTCCISRLNPQRISFMILCRSISISGKLEQGSSQLHAEYLSSLSNYIDPSTLNVRYNSAIGYSLQSKRNIKRGSVILSIPESVWQPYSADYALMKFRVSDYGLLDRVNFICANQLMIKSPKQQDSFLKSICLACHLVDMKNEGHVYPSFLFNAYFPTGINNNRTHPLLMDEGRLSLLHGTSVRAIDTRRKMWHRIADSLSSTISRDEFLWAMGIILSRALSDPFDAFPFALIPALDFANHSYARANAEHSFTSKRAFELVACQDIEYDEEVCISYGQNRDSASLMALYGFYDVNNSANDVVRLPVFRDPAKDSDNKIVQLCTITISAKTVLQVFDLSWVELENVLLQNGTSSSLQELRQEVIRVFRDLFGKALLEPVRAIVGKTASEVSVINALLFSIDIAISAFNDGTHEIQSTSDLLQVAQKWKQAALQLTEIDKIDIEIKSHVSEHELAWRRSCGMIVFKELDSLLSLRQFCATYRAAVQ